jgi:hypothetical protein
METLEVPLEALFDILSQILNLNFNLQTSNLIISCIRI